MAKPIQRGMREQGQLTFNLEDSVPEAPRHFAQNDQAAVAEKAAKKVAGGESGRTNAASDNYWSSTSNPNNTDNALNANFNNGNVNNNNKTNTNYVRAVRGGKWQPSPPLISKTSGGDLFSLKNIYKAYLKCRRRKRNTANALKFELNLEENLVGLQRRLVDRSYRPGRSILFAATKPKLREIFAADFADRVAHHILVAELEKVWEPRFITDSCACRLGKGIHGAQARLRQFIRRVSANGTREAYFIKLDIRNFFNTLDKDVLLQIISKKVRDPELLWLTRTIIYHDCTEDYVPRDRENLLRRVPPHKSLFSQPPDHGLPIGNLSSQFFANVYLDRLDQFVKRELKCRHYLRYADDFVLLDPDPGRLGEWMGRIEEFLRDRLRLELHPRRVGPAPVSNGVDFLGYVVRHNYVLVRRRVVNNLKLRLERYQKRLVSPCGSDYLCFNYEYDLLDELFSCLNSYLGHFRWANSHRLVEALWKRYEFLGHYFKIELSTLTLKRRYPLPRMYSSLPEQYESILAHFPGCLVFFQVGSFYVMFNSQSILAREHFELKVMRGKGWGAQKAGFPVVAWPKYRRLAMERSLCFVQVRQRADLLAAELRERLPVGAYLPWEAAA